MMLFFMGTEHKLWPKWEGKDMHLDKDATKQKDFGGEAPTSPFHFP